MAKKSYMNGDKVETVHGEKLVVESVVKIPAKMKKGKVVVPERVFIVAKSGGHRVQFPVSLLK